MSDLTDFEERTLDALAQHYPDWLLSRFVSMANTQGVSIGVTLVVGGNLVTGLIIGGREYFTEMGAALARATGSDPDAGAKDFGRLVEDLYPTAADEGDEARSKEEGQDPRTGVRFIHLRNARVLHGTTIIPGNFQGHLWRGRLAAVDGFMLGEPEASGE